MATFKVIYEMVNGKQGEALFDHAPVLGSVVYIQGMGIYAEIIAIEPA